jgi:hypothetical protein
MNSTWLELFKTEALHFQKTSKPFQVEADNSEVQVSNADFRSTVYPKQNL